jgi:uncharacterized protein YbjT (DUF2867 family)
VNVFHHKDGKARSGLCAFIIQSMSSSMQERKVMSAKILVVGGTGMLGEPVARRLQADGYCVRVMTRSPDRARVKFGTDFEVVVGQIEDQQSLADAMCGCEDLHINLYDGSDLDLERQAVEAITRAAARAGVQRITYLSGATVREENCWFAGTRAKFDAEAAIRASGLPYTIFKATTFMEALSKYVRGNRASVIGKQPHTWHWIAAGDYSRMVSRAYATPASANKDLFIHGPEAHTMQGALVQYCAAAHPEATVGTMPMWMASMVASLARQKELKDALPFFSYTQKVREQGSPNEAIALLGAPATTLTQWSRNQSRKKVLT